MTATAILMNVVPATAGRKWTALRITAGYGRAPDGAPQQAAVARAMTSGEPFPVVNTPEWDVMNKRRAELIRKDLDGGLTPAERIEYERLQRQSLAAAVSAFPQPKPEFQELARLRDELRAASGPVTE